MEERITKLMQEFGLTYKQVKFCLKFDGNASRTARMVGYKHAHVQGSRLLKNDKVKALLDRLACRSDTNDRVLDRTMLMTLWSQLASDPDAKVQDRLKAMDSLAKAQGIFIDRSQVISNVRIEHLDKLTDDELLGKLTDVMTTLQDAGITLALPSPERTD